MFISYKMFAKDNKIHCTLHEKVSHDQLPWMDQIKPKSVSNHNAGVDVKPREIANLKKEYANKTEKLKNRNEIVRQKRLEKNKQIQEKYKKHNYYEAQKNNKTVETDDSKQRQHFTEAQKKHDIALTTKNLIMTQGLSNVLKIMSENFKNTRPDNPKNNDVQETNPNRIINEPKIKKLNKRDDNLIEIKNRKIVYSGPKRDESKDKFYPISKPPKNVYYEPKKLGTKISKHRKKPPTKLPFKPLEVFKPIFWLKMSKSGQARFKKKTKS